MTPRILNKTRTPLARLVACVVVISIATDQQAIAQIASPVYVNDSPAASESLSRVDDLVAAGNLREAAGVLQDHLLDDANRLVLAPGSDTLYISLRRAIHAKLLANEPLLKAYRERYTIEARRLLQSGREIEVEHSYLLTSVGFEATLRIAQRSLEDARFHASRLYLEQIDRHPDRTSTGARDAASLATMLDSYLNDPAFHQLRDRWRIDAGLEPVETPIAAQPERIVGRSPLDPFEAVDLSSIVSSPLRSRELSLRPIDPAPPSRSQTREQRTHQRERTAHEQFVLPSLMGETLYVYDGVLLRALDRFTLDTIWEQSLSGIDADDVRSDFLQRYRQNLEDVCSMAIQEDHLIVAEGIAAEGIRIPDATIASFNPSSGALQWRVDPRTRHPLLEDASVRGPVRIHEGTLVVSFVKQVRQRRLLSMLMAGFDIQTGRLRWVVPVCSSGSLPYGQQYLPAQQMTIDRGIAYRVERLGTISSIEIETGRIRWVLLDASEGLITNVRSPWQIPSPVVHDATLYTFSPNEQRLMAIDTDDASVRWTRPSTSFNAPIYLELLADTLLAIGASSVVSLDLAGDDPSTQEAQVIVPPQDELFVGRVARAGDSMVIPQTSGLLVTSLGNDAPLDRVPLEHSGNVLLTHSQVIITDANNMHSYLLWDVAERLLLARMNENPTDPTPASTYARLAYEDGRYDKILNAVDLALEAIEQDPLRQANQSARAALFEAILEMVTREPNIDEAPSSRQGVLPGQTKVALFERLDRLASTSAQRVIAIFARGAYHERASEPDVAIELYQRILESRQLAEAQFMHDQLAHKAWREATNRITNLVRLYGSELYAPFDAMAQAQLARGFQNVSDDRVELFARQFPLSGASAQAWGVLAERAMANSQPRSAIASLEAAVLVALETRATSQEWFTPLLSDLIVLLEQNERTTAAIDHLEHIALLEPSIQLATAEGTVPIGARLEQLRDTLRSGTLPLIGRLPESPQVLNLEGWLLEEPMIELAGKRLADACVLGTPAELAMWEVDPEGGMRERWRIDRDVTSVLVWVDEHRTLVSHFTENGRTLEMLDTRDATSLWTSQPPRDAHDARPPQAGDRLHVRMPNGTASSIHETLFASTPRFAVLAERGGLVWGVDLETGEIVWKQELLTSIFDVVTIEDSVAIGGRETNQHGDAFDVAKILALQDGSVLHTLEHATGPVMWMRESSERELVIATDRSITSWDPIRGVSTWEVTGIAGSHTRDAWSFPGRLITLNTNAELRQIDAETGTPVLGVLNTNNRFEEYTNRILPIRAALIGDAAAFATNLGIVLFDHRGTLTGTNLNVDERELIPAAFAQNAMVTITQEVVEQVRRTQWFRLSIFDTGSVRLLDERQISLVAQPTGIHLLDNRILIEVGGTTLVLDTTTDPLDEQ
ncbi:MAG: outer membrane protein assembly factor BamB family protein [Planctomycetota bacterium]|jgi:outer membrane protein assembly factor BamB